MLFKLNNISRMLSKQSAILNAARLLSPQGGAVFYREKTTKELPYPKLDVYAMKAAMQPTKGKIYDKKPFKVDCVAGKTYVWCTCGWSKSQPFCDGHHNNPHFKIKLKPLVFKCIESGEYWFCNCKQTSQRPFCDGTHRKVEIQTAIKS